MEISDIAPVQPHPLFEKEEKQAHDAPVPSVPKVVDLVEQQRARIEELIKCPICLGPTTPPMIQCHNGHMTCNGCIAGLENMGPAVKCPLCRVDFSSAQRSRNLMMERICKEAGYCLTCSNGCTDVPFDELDAHEARGCPRLAPLLACPHPDCKERVRPALLLSHGLDAHGSSSLFNFGTVCLLDKEEDIELHAMAPSRHRSFAAMTQAHVIAIYENADALGRATEPVAHAILYKYHGTQKIDYLVETLWERTGANVRYTLHSGSLGGRTSLTYTTDGKEEVRVPPKPDAQEQDADLVVLGAKKKQARRKLELREDVDAGITVPATHHTLLVIENIPDKEEKDGTGERPAKRPRTE